MKSTLPQGLFEPMFSNFLAWLWLKKIPYNIVYPNWYVVLLIVRSLSYLEGCILEATGLNSSSIYFIISGRQ